MARQPFTVGQLGAYGYVRCLQLAASWHCLRLSKVLLCVGDLAASLNTFPIIVRAERAPGRLVEHHYDINRSVHTTPDKSCRKDPSFTTGGCRMAIRMSRSQAKASPPMAPHTSSRRWKQVQKKACLIESAGPLTWVSMAWTLKATLRFDDFERCSCFFK